MQTNGTLSPAVIAENENQYGEISASSVMWGDPVECVIVTNTDTRLGKYEDGEFRMSAYTVTIYSDTEFFDAIVSNDESIVVTGASDAIVIKANRFNFERVVLQRHGEYLGEFRVQTCEIFPRMGRIVFRVAQ